MLAPKDAPCYLKRHGERSIMDWTLLVAYAERLLPHFLFANTAPVWERWYMQPEDSEEAGPSTAEPRVVIYIHIFLLADGCFKTSGLSPSAQGFLQEPVTSSRVGMSWIVFSWNGETLLLCFSGRGYLSYWTWRKGRIVLGLLAAILWPRDRSMLGKTNTKSRQAAKWATWEMELEVWLSHAWRLGPPLLSEIIDFPLSWTCSWEMTPDCSLTHSACHYRADRFIPEPAECLLNDSLIRTAYKPLEVEWTLSFL